LDEAETFGYRQRRLTGLNVQTTPQVAYNHTSNAQIAPFNTEFISLLTPSTEIICEKV